MRAAVIEILSRIGAEKNIPRAGYDVRLSI